MQHLFDFYCFLCKQGVRGSNPLTSTNHHHFNPRVSPTPYLINRLQPVARPRHYSTGESGPAIQLAVTLPDFDAQRKKLQNNLPLSQSD
jgi:hypothetical protein